MYFSSSAFTLIDSDAKQKYLEESSFKRPLNLQVITDTETSSYVAGQALETCDCTGMCEVFPKPSLHQSMGREVSKASHGLKHMPGSKCWLGAWCRFPLSSGTGEHHRMSPTRRNVDARLCFGSCCLSLFLL